MSLKRSHIILLIIIAVGFLLRFYRLGSESIWVDEAISIGLARQSPLVIIFERGLDVHPPLYFLLLHYWMAIFGDGVFALRFMSLIFGVLSVLYIYKLTKKLFDENIANVSALLLSLSVYHIYYSQEVRMYTLVTLLAILSMYYYAKLERRASIRSKAEYLITTFLLMMTHYSGFLILITQTIRVLSPIGRKRKDCLGRRQWLLLQGILFLMLMPWLVFVLSNNAKLRAGNILSSTAGITWISVISAFLEYSGSPWIFFIFIGLIAGLFINRKKDAVVPGKSLRLIVQWLLIPSVVILVFYSLAKRPFLSKYMVVSSIPFFMLVAAAMERLKRINLKRSLLALYLALSLISLASFYARVNKLPWDQVAKFVAYNYREGDVVIFNDEYYRDDIFKYYCEKDILSRYLPMDTGKYYKKLDPETADLLFPYVDDKRRAWIILAHVLDEDLLLKDIFAESHSFLYHNIFTSYSFVTNRINNYLEVFLIEKR